jgi:predicted molibdopterin-dependent oxidoreductase YjgC
VNSKDTEGGGEGPDRRGAAFLVVDGRSVRIEGASTVAAVLLNAGIESFRRSVTDEGRGPLCAMGICHECRVTIGGVAHRRACLVIASEGMVVTTGARSS